MTHAPAAPRGAGLHLLQSPSWWLGVALASAIAVAGSGPARSGTL